MSASLARDCFDCGTRRYPVGRIFCIGRNYAEHVAELGNTVPDDPIVFMKPSTALVNVGESIRLPRGESEVHMETELVVLLGEKGIAGLALGLDLTRRKLQTVLKSRGHPWERCKAFEGSAPLGPWTPFHPKIHRLEAITFEGWVNDECRQRGNTADMLFPITQLREHLAHTWDLRPGDIIYTGTPAGVGSLVRGDRVMLRAEQLSGASWTIE